MEKLEKYREAIKEVISEYGQYKLDLEDVRTELIFHVEGDNYLLFRVGWHKRRRIYGCIMHLDIIDEKIWIQYNGTEVDLAEELVVLGVPKHDIVLGFHSPYMRQFTEYGMS